LVEVDASVNQNINIKDDVKIKVKRFNSRTERLKRWLKGHGIHVKQGITIDGYVTANVRRWNEDTKSYGDWQCVTELNHNLLTNAGKDFFFQQCYKDSGLGANGTYFVGVTTTAITPAVGDTTLSGELSTNGFSRAAGTYAHTAGQTTTTVTITYTASGVPSPNTVQGGALFTAASSGTMSHIFIFTSTAFAINDQLQLIITITFT
jgi:hypothetical protein